MGAFDAAADMRHLPRVGSLYPGRLVDGDLEVSQAEGDYPLAERTIAPPLGMGLGRLFAL